MSVKPIPDGYSTVTPYLVVDGAARAIEFYKTAFGAIELFRITAPGGRIGHAEIKIGESPVMLADEYPDMGFRGPQPGVTPPVSLLIYDEDVDGRFRTALAAGAEEVRPVQDQFYGDRSGTLRDPFGHVWTIATHKEDVPPDELQRRMEKAMQGGECG